MGIKNEVYFNYKVVDRVTMPILRFCLFAYVSEHYERYTEVFIKMMAREGKQQLEIHAEGKCLFSREAFIGEGLIDVSLRFTKTDRRVVVDLVSE